MKKLFSILIALMTMASLLVTTVSAAPATLLTQTPELGQLKICKVAGSGVAEGTMFTFRVYGNTYNVPAGPADRGYCVLAGRYPVDSHVTIEEVIPSGYYVSRIVVKPDRTVSKNTSQGVVTVRIISGVIEAIFTNKVAGSPTPTRTPTSVNTSTPRPTKTATSTPSCAPNCTPTSTPVPQGRMQICKEAEDPGVSGYFTFKFEGTRSREVPVAACAGLIAVNAGTLTITEVAQTGYVVSEIYTIPADRLISKDLNGGSAQIRIVEGGPASQTIVIFRNRSVTTGSFTPTSTLTSTPTFTTTPNTLTPTATPTVTGSVTATSTFTPTSTATPTSTFTPTVTTPSCPPLQVYADFGKVAAGDSVEGMDTVAPYLDINATNGTAVKVAQGVTPQVYLASNGIKDDDWSTAPGYLRVTNGGLVSDGGFSDVDTKTARGAHEYTFTFDTGITASNFSLHMLDFGDLNTTQSVDHVVRMVAYDANGNPIPGASQELNYQTLDPTDPYASDIFGDLWFSGDAVGAEHGEPGNYTWDISGSGIKTIVLSFPVGHDPNIAFDLLSFTVAGVCQCQAATTADFVADFSQLAPNDSVEGMGAVVPHLDINATKGRAVKVAQAVLPQVYLAPNGLVPENLPAPFNYGRIVNGGMVADGGFSDFETKIPRGAHEYTFTFDTGITASNFSLHMLDFGDLNPTENTSHIVRMIAYDVNGNPIPGASQELNYMTEAANTPRDPVRSEDPWFIGDAISSKHGEPGNYTWDISGSGIHSVVLTFPEGHDPNVAFDRLAFSLECP